MGEYWNKTQNMHSKNTCADHKHGGQVILHAHAQLNHIKI